MIDNGYLFARDNKRIFINTSLGCNGQCSYCYLPKLGYSNHTNENKNISAEELIKYIEDNKIDINSNTLITLGCFSECWDDEVKKETISIIKYFLKKGNQIQLSTKKQIFKEEIIGILPLIKYYGQLVIFVSSATISKHDTIEKNTTPVLDRFKNFELFNELQIPVVLYLKPVLKGITIKDLDLYKQYIKQYGIKDIVVGSTFTNNVSEEPVHFSNNEDLFYTENSDEETIIKELSGILNIYRRSSEVMSSYKIEKVRTEVNKLLTNDKTGHGMDHVNRVLDLALKFAEKEKADKEIVSLIALLHDVDDYKLFGMESAKEHTNARKIMNDSSIDKNIQDEICLAIDNIGYGKRLKGIVPVTLESKIVSDADMCDALGANGILRTYAYSISNNYPFFDRNIFPKEDITAHDYKRVNIGVCHFFEKLLRIKDFILTESGKEESLKRYKILVDFLYQFFDEENAPEWKEYLDKFLKGE